MTTGTMYGEPTKGAITGVRARNRQELIAGLQPRIGGVSFAFGAMPKPPDVFIALPCCGEVRCWMELTWVPDHDVGPCSCGNWFIKYGGFAGDEVKGS